MHTIRSELDFQALISTADHPHKNNPRLMNKAPPVRRCTYPDCDKKVRSKGLCKAHGGGLRCLVEGCNRSSQGKGYCIRHGGGKRCSMAGCNRSSQSNGLCKSHGGGLRCQAPHCNKSSQGGGFCRLHGGGHRCEHPGCDKGAQRGGYCATHGGNRACQYPDCKKNDRGGGFCAEHGGGRRCSAQGCNKPARKQGMCSQHAASLQPQASSSSEMALDVSFSHASFGDRREYVSSDASSTPRDYTTLYSEPYPKQEAMRHPHMEMMGNLDHPTTTTYGNRYDMPSTYSYTSYPPHPHSVSLPPAQDMATLQVMPDPLPYPYHEHHHHQPTPVSLQPPYVPIRHYDSYPHHQPPHHTNDPHQSRMMYNY